MFAEYDRTHFPLVKVTIFGIPNEEDFDLFLEEWLKLYEEKNDFMFLFDIRFLGEVSLKYCVKMSMFIYRLRKRPYQYLQKSMILLNNNNVKRLLDFIFVLQPPVAPVYLYNTDQSSEDLKELALSINRESLTDNIVYIKPNKPFLPFM
tara:strand:- start:21 stop:467 length:447 start_codon:yes stop_codon:yes gene_type:complete